MGNENSQKREVTKKKDCEFITYSSIKDGMHPSRLWDGGILTRRQVDYALSKLRNANLVRKVGYGTWETLKEFSREELTKHKRIRPRVAKEHTTLPMKKVRGHGFVAVLKVPELEGWKDRERIMEKAGIPFVPLKAQKSQRIEVGDIRRVWLSDKSITFYLGERSFFAENALKASWDAISYLLGHVARLERLLRMPEGSLKSGGKYALKFSRQHHSLVKNALARQYDREKKKLYVYDSAGLWLLIDNSHNLHELETVRNGTAVNENVFMQRFFNELNETRVTPRFIMDALAKNAENMENMAKNMDFYGKNIASHVEAIRTLSSEVKGFSGAVDGFGKRMDDFSVGRTAEVVGEDYTLMKIEILEDTGGFWGLILSPETGRMMAHEFSLKKGNVLMMETASAQSLINAGTAKRI